MKKIFCTLAILLVSVLFHHPVYADSIELQPGALDGKDAGAWDALPNNNLGNDPYLYVKNNRSGQTIYGLIEFDLSLIPNSTINSAILHLVLMSRSGSSETNAYRLTSSWDESTVTWNTQPTVDLSNPIVSNGGATAPLYTTVTWDITDIVAGWHSGTYDNYGLELRNVLESTQNYYASSDDISLAGSHPKLLITYTVPEPTSLFLLCMSGLGLVFKHRKK